MKKLPFDIEKVNSRAKVINEKGWDCRYLGKIIDPKYRYAFAAFDPDQLSEIVFVCSEEGGLPLELGQLYIVQATKTIWYNLYSGKPGDIYFPSEEAARNMAPNKEYLETRSIEIPIDE